MVPSLQATPSWRGRGSRWFTGRSVAISVFCAVMMTFTLQMPAAAASGGGQPGGGLGGNNTTGAVDYPYAVPASLFPAPANLSSARGVEGVSAIPLPSAPASYAVVNASVLSNTSFPTASVWYAVASYSPGDARLIATAGSCGPGCGDLPLSWSNQSVVATFSTSVTAVKATSIGATIVLGATSGGTTYLYEWSLLQGKWIQFGPTIYGQLAALAADPVAAAAVTIMGDSIEITTISLANSTIGQVELQPDSSGATNVVSAAVTLAPTGPVFGEYVAFSANGSNEIDFASSTDSIHFLGPTRIGAFVPVPTNTFGAAVGQTLLQSRGGISGQLTMTSAGSELTTLYTTYSSGQVIPVTLSSGAGGAAWLGPYLSGPINGTTLNPTLTVGPNGLEYAVWQNPDDGLGSLVEASYEPDGLPVTPPEDLPVMTGNGTTPIGAPTIAVDAFSRPLMLWPATSPGNSGAIAYTGGYLPANVSLNLTRSVLLQTLGDWDFGRGGATPAGLASFLTNATTEITLANSSLASGNLCSAQNITGIYLYQNLTHIPLSIAAGSGTVCATALAPNGADSPLLSSSGIQTPNTYLAVYLDWALEAEAVPIATSPLSTVTNFAPYALSIPIANLPKPVNGSETESGHTESISITPTPYSPTVYELAATSTIPATNTNIEGPACNPPHNMQRIWEYYTTTVTSWVNVSINNGSSHPFTSTSGSYSSVWVYNLTADQRFFWKGNYTALTVQVEKISNPCNQPSVSYQNTTTYFAQVALQGAFNTSLTIVPGKNFVTASFNPTNHSSAKLTVQFNSTLPSLVHGNLSNASGTQTWSASSPAINGAYTFSRYSGANQAYTLSVASTSRAGSGTSPGSPSFSYSSWGSSSPEQAGASCSFTLSSSVPTVSISNSTGAPYTSLNASTVNVTWNSTVNALGFFTYFEVGTPINWSIAGIVPAHAPSGAWVYTIELHGLEPMVSYNGTFGVSWNSGCLVEEDQIVTENFQTAEDPAFTTDAPLPYPWEQDLPYDSVSRVGGGIEVGWDTPALPPGGTNLVLLGGYVRTAHTNVPFAASEVNQTATNPHGGIGSLLNLSGSPLSLSPDTRYPYTIVANYTYNITVRHTVVVKPEIGVASSSFLYQYSTSHDGLSDIEKGKGWVLPLVAYGASGVGACSAGGTASAQDCQIDPSSMVTPYIKRYATNGLVNDFVEKEFGLDPFTIDTAHSHMLDTWNLTFDLGRATSQGTSTLLASLSADFHFYYENGSYDFAHACQVYQPGQGACSFNVPSGEPTHLTCLQGIQCYSQRWIGDSNSSAAKDLWSASALPALEYLISSEDVGWLRAVTGQYGTERTITVWGKLSWGANPLTSSTSHDGLSDGAQPDPMGPVVVQLNLTAWQASNITSRGGAGVSPLLNLTSNPHGGTLYYSGYGPCSGGGCTTASGWAGLPEAGTPYYSIPWWGYCRRQRSGRDFKSVHLLGGSPLYE